jgi:hypothetical protein
MNPRERYVNPATVDNGQGKRGDELLVLAVCSGDSNAFVKLSSFNTQTIFQTSDRRMPGHFAVGDQVEALTREKGIACICTRPRRQIAY